MTSSLEFKLPVELSPMPTMASDDEESFVILGKSLIPEVDASLNNLHLEPISSGPIEEGKKLINMELSRLDTPETQVQDTNIAGTSVSLSPEEVQQKVDTLIAENIKLRDTIMKNNIAMESQHEKIVAWKEEVQKTHSAHKQKFAEAKDFISQLKADKESLTSELVKCQEIKDMYEKELLQLKAELKQKKNESEPSNINLKKDEELLIAAQKISELQNLLQTVTAANNRLTNENEKFKQNSTSMDMEKKDEAIKMLDNKLRQSEDAAHKIIKSLNTDIINLRSELCMTVNLQEDLDNVRKQLMNSQSTITMLQQTNAGLMAQLATEQANVKRLKESESIKDDYFALQQQVELYKADFEAERTAKENLKTEKEQIINDFLQIQKRNNELNEEIELLKERGFEVIGTGRRSTSSTSSSNASTQASSPLNQYECPICNLKYRSLKLLEQHIETCIPEPNWL